MERRREAKKNELEGKGGRKSSGVRALWGWPGCPPNPGLLSPAQPRLGRAREGRNTHRCCFQAFYPCSQTLGDRARFATPACPPRSGQERSPGQERGAGDFPPLAPVSFLPGERRERRPYQLLFSPRGRDKALIDALLGKGRLTRPCRLWGRARLLWGHRDRSRMSGDPTGTPRQKIPR